MLPVLAAGAMRGLTLLGRGIGRGAMFGFKMEQKAIRALKVALQQRERAKAVMRMSNYVTADQTYYRVLSRIPAGPKWSKYRNQIQLARYGSEKNAKAYVVYAEPKAHNRTFDTAKTVMYVKPKKNFLGKVRTEVLVLARFSPWTSDTLPFSPQKNEAVIVIRKVTKHEMQAISKKREADRPQWRKELAEAGVRTINLTKKLPELKTQVVQDLAFDALRLEFGYGGAKPAPHWRPGSQEALAFTKRLFKGRSLFSKALTDSNFTAWRKWPPRVESSIKIDTLKNLQKFSKRLKIRV